MDQLLQSLCINYACTADPTHLQWAAVQCYDGRPDVQKSIELPRLRFCHLWCNCCFCQTRVHKHNYTHYFYVDPFPAPKNVHLFDVRPGLLSFTWNPVTQDCSALHYDIQTNCGNCANSTHSPSINCSLTNDHLSRKCSIKVKSVTCGNISGSWSNPIRVNLKGNYPRQLIILLTLSTASYSCIVPDPPVISTISLMYENERLSSLDIQFTKSTTV